ncbi:MAG: hypothetical protein ABIM99_04610 [Candidatus Dojkabacteria bacterium]
MVGESEIDLFYIDGELSHGYVDEDLATVKNIKGIFGPSNIRWEKEMNYSTPLEFSSKKAKRTEKAIEYILANGYEIIEQNPIGQATYSEWYELYKANINNKEIGVIHLQEDWLIANPTVTSTGLFIKQNGKIIAGIILIEEKVKQSFQCAFRAHVYEKVKDSSIAEILEYMIDQFAINHSYKLITRGTDPNIYGVRLKASLNDFKKQYGFVAKPLDYKGHYHPRYLIFFKEYEEILTYTYKDKSVNTDIEEKVFTKEELAQYTYPASILGS